MRALGGANQDALHRHNLSTVLRHLHERGSATRAELTAMTGLNRSTVAGLVSSLRGRGLVSEAEPVPRGGPGRPSPVVLLRRDQWVVLALEISVNSIAAAVVGMGGHVLSHDRVERHASDPEAVVAALEALVSSLLDRQPQTTPLAVGVAVVGVVRAADGWVHVAPNLGWHDVPLAALLARSLGHDVPVFVGNDADLAAVAEHLRGAAADVDDVLYLHGEVGVGGGVIAGGRPLAGVAGYAGEVGHMLVNGAGRACRCGATGCWETETSELALLRRTGRDGAAGPDAVADVLAAAATGDTDATAAVEETARWLGLGIGSLVNLFNPSRVVLGGFFAALHGHARTTIDEAAAVQSMLPPADGVEIVPSALGIDAPLLGAAELAFEDTLRDPTTVPLAAAST